MEGGQLEAAFLIEAQGMQVIVCCNKKYPLTAFCTRDVDNFLYKLGANALSFSPTIQGDDLTITV